MTIARMMAAMCLVGAIVVVAAPIMSGAQELAASADRSGGDGDDWSAAVRLTSRVCTDCHALGAITAERRTAGVWQDVMDAMATRSDGTAAEFASIRQFLTRTRGLVLVNTASAEDFVAVLGLSADQADAVVAYRSAHGRFVDRDALLAVPGLESSGPELDAQALWFD